MRNTLFLLSIIISINIYSQSKVYFYKDGYNRNEVFEEVRQLYFPSQGSMILVPLLNEVKINEKKRIIHFDSTWGKLRLPDKFRPEVFKVSITISDNLSYYLYLYNNHLVVINADDEIGNYSETLRFIKINGIKDTEKLNFLSSLKNDEYGIYPYIFSIRDSVELIKITVDYLKECFPNFRVNNLKEKKLYKSASLIEGTNSQELKELILISGNAAYSPSECDVFWEMKVLVVVCKNYLTIINHEGMQISALSNLRKKLNIPNDKYNSILQELFFK